MGQRAPEPRDREIARRLRTLRLQRGWSQAGLGAVLGITPQQVQKYERGTNRITAGRLARIAETFGVPTTFFYSDGEGCASVPESSSTVIELGFLRTHGALRLVRAYSSITDAGIRGSLLKLAESLAGAREAPSHPDAVVRVPSFRKS